MSPRPFRGWTRMPDGWVDACGCELYRDREAGWCYRDNRACYVVAIEFVQVKAILRGGVRP